MNALTTMTARQRLSAARTTLVLDAPFFGSLALRMKMVEAPEITDTMATDGRSLFYDPAFVERISADELVGVWAHEVMHPAMQHHTRRANRDPQAWNEAADYAINPHVLEAGFKLPEGGLVDPQFKGMTAEQIYAARLPETSKRKKDGGSGPGTGKGMAAGGVLDAPEPAQDAAEWQVAVKQAAQAAKMMGRLPGGLARMVDDATAPKVDWKALLRRFVQQCAAADYSWRAPNKRYVASGLYLPCLRSESMPPMVVLRDTSGSTSAHQGEFWAEIKAIVEECQPEQLHVIDVDAGVHQHVVFERGEPLPAGLEVKGYGGTDFRPGFDHVAKEGVEPACLIYLTDMEGTFPEQAPDYPVLWAATTDHPAPWGETVKIEAGAS